MDNDYLHGALAENVLTLLCFFDEEAGMVKNAVDPDLFESSIFQTIARAAGEYHDSYDKAPKEHLPDILEGMLKNADEAEIQLYDTTFRNLFEASDGINPGYVINQLSKFVEMQSMKLGTVEAMKCLQSNDMDAARSALDKALKTNYEVFDLGLNFKNKSEAFSFLKDQDTGTRVRTGIPELDKFDICPARKEMFLVLALANRGKTWAMMHLAKMALLQRWKVLHVTLEMPEDQVAMRYAQSFFSVSKRRGESAVANFIKDDRGLLQTIDFSKIVRPGLDDSDILKYLSKKHDSLARNFNLRIKQFAPRTLKVRGLEAYMDGLARIDKFMPDMLVLDYADDMYINAQNHRIDTSNLYKDLRRIAVERNIALVTASQANRAAERAKIITMENFSEDFSKAHTADIVLSYNQVKTEKPQGIARLFTAKVRNDSSGHTTVISQDYQNGQFCLGSARANDHYWDMLNTEGMEDEENE